MAANRAVSAARATAGYQRPSRPPSPPGRTPPDPGRGGLTAAIDTDPAAHDTAPRARRSGRDHREDLAGERGRVRRRPPRDDQVPAAPFGEPDQPAPVSRARAGRPVPQRGSEAAGGTAPRGRGRNAEVGLEDVSPRESAARRATASGGTLLRTERAGAVEAEQRAVASSPRPAPGGQRGRGNPQADPPRSAPPPGASSSPARQPRDAQGGEEPGRRRWWRCRPGRRDRVARGRGRRHEMPDA